MPGIYKPDNIFIIVFQKKTMSKIFLITRKKQKNGKIFWDIALKDQQIDEKTKQIVKLQNNLDDQVEKFNLESEKKLTEMKNKHSMALLFENIYARSALRVDHEAKDEDCQDKLKLKNNENEQLKKTIGK